MSTRTLSTPASSPPRGHPAASRTALDVPVLDQKPGRLGRRLAVLPGKDHPVWTYVLGILFAVVAIASLSIVAAVGALIAVAAKHWRLAGFLLFALDVESAAYRATTLVIHRHRPEVLRLEKLPVNASYPSGHTAASIAVYGGLALLLTSRIRNRKAQVAIWVVAILIPVFVAFSRMYRGMHHPLDIAGGVVIGVAAVSMLVLVTRASGEAAR